MNTWRFNDVPFLLESYTKDYVGFVYMITDNVTKKYYIGQKLFYKTKTRPPLKGKKRKRKEVIESDWKTYCGSSRNLLEDIEKGDINNFDRIILFLCETKSSMNYVELLYQIYSGSLFDKNCYNGIVNVRIGKSAINARPSEVERIQKLQILMKGL
jgi:hypothetical protein